MLYCEKCMRFAGDCYCGARKYREIKENDPVFLTVKDALTSGQIEPILNENNIPYIKRGRLGAGLVTRLGPMLETYTFFVPYGAYEKAKDLIAVFE